MFKKLGLGLSVFGLLSGLVTPVQAVETLKGQEFATVGVTVTKDANMYQRTLQNLGASQVQNDHILVVDGDMINRYIHDGSNQGTNVYSSSKIKFNDQVTGVNVNIVTPQNIQRISRETYINAAITSGIKNADITVGSEVPVTGDGALVGIYALMDSKGVLNPQQASLAQSELGLVSQVVNDAKVNDGQMNAVMADVKAEVAQAVQNGTINNVQGDQVNNNTVVNNIVNNTLNNYGLQLPDWAVQRLVDFGTQFAGTDIAKDGQVQQQLGALAEDVFAKGGDWMNQLSDKVKEKWDDPEFQENTKNMFTKVLDAIGSFFSAIGEWVGSLFG